jgi:spoIIIJ-associated protein
MSQRFEGRNLEEALQNAAQAFGVERWQLTYHVLLEKRGFLGGMKRIVVEAEVNSDAPSPATAATPVAAPAATEEVRAPQADRGPRPAGGSRSSSGGRDSGRSRGRSGGGGRGRGGERGGERGGNRGPSRELRSGDFETFLGDLPEQTPESPAAKIVRDWVEGVLFLAKIDVVLRTEENETQILVRLYGADGPRLTDRNGELLDAIQVLANKALVGRKVEKEIELDSEEFKSAREQDLVRRAQQIADRVRLDGREELLPPMSPIERRIVHIALRDDADVTTDSRGEGFFKRVAVIPRPLESGAAVDAQVPDSEPRS